MIKLFSAFMAHLKGSEMEKEDKAALQHVNQVWSILKDVANYMHVFQLADLLNEDKIGDAWLAPFVKVWKLGTAKSYLWSLCLCRLPDGQKSGGPNFNDVHSLRKRALQARTVQESEDLVIIPEQIRDLLQSKSKQVKTVGEMLEDPNLRTQHHNISTTCQKYLVFRILVSNGQGQECCLASHQRHCGEQSPRTNGLLLTFQTTRQIMRVRSRAFPQPLWDWTVSYLHMLRTMEGYNETETESQSFFVPFRDIRGARP